MLRLRMMGGCEEAQARRRASIENRIGRARPQTNIVVPDPTRAWDRRINRNGAPERPAFQSIARRGQVAKWCSQFLSAMRALTPFFQPNAVATLNRQGADVLLLSSSWRGASRLGLRIEASLLHLEGKCRLSTAGLRPAEIDNLGAGCVYLPAFGACRRTLIWQPGPWRVDRSVGRAHK